MNRKLTLQINTAGAWKNVVTFDKDKREPVLAAAGLLARILGPSTKWALIDEFGHRQWLKFSDNPNEIINASAQVIQAIADTPKPIHGD